MKTTIRKPLLKSIFYTLIPVFSGFGAEMVVKFYKLPPDIFAHTRSLIVFLTFFIISILIGFLIIKILPLNLQQVGFKKIPYKASKKTLYFLPLIIVVLLNPIGTGIESLSLVRIFVILLFSAVVGLNEELYFRGIILSLFQDHFKKGIFVSALCFSLGHLINFLSYPDMMFVLLQVVFALAIGMAFAEIAIISKSLWPVTLLHASIDFTGLLSENMEMDTRAIVVSVVQILILVGYSIILWKKIPKSYLNQIKKSDLL